MIQTLPGVKVPDLHRPSEPAPVEETDLPDRGAEDDVRVRVAPGRQPCVRGLGGQFSAVGVTTVFSG